jgi:hypothetical protein
MLLPLIPVLGVTWIVAVGNGLPRPLGRAAPLTVRGASVAPLIVIVTYGLLEFDVPSRVAFAAARGAFERHLKTAPVSEARGERLGWVGIYWVDRYAADPRGGVYFRTGSGPAGGPDEMSYGFAYRPNGEGTPFGAAEYRVSALVGEWYWFQASDDWF